MLLFFRGQGTIQAWQLLILPSPVQKEMKEGTSEKERLFTKMSS